MLELFIALFGLGYYGIKIAGDKVGQKRATINSRNRMAWQSARKAAWCSKVYSETAVHEAREAAEGNTWVRTLAQAYLKLPSNKDLTETQAMNLIYDALRHRHNKKDHTEYNKCLMWILAQRGKILSTWDTACDSIVLLPAFTEREKLIWDRQYEFAMLLLHEVQKFAPDSKMVFTTPWSADHTVTAYDAEKDLAKFHYKVGQIRWLQLTFFDDNLQYH